MTKKHYSNSEGTNQDKEHEENLMDIVFAPGTWYSNSLWTQLIRPIRKTEEEPEGFYYYLQDEANTLAAIIHFHRMRASPKSKSWFIYTVEEGTIYSGFKERRQRRHIEILKECNLIQTERSERVHGERRTRINTKLIKKLIDEVWKQAYILGDLDDTGRKDKMPQNVLYALFRVRFLYESEEMRIKEIEITPDVKAEVLRTQRRKTGGISGRREGSTPDVKAEDYGSTKDKEKEHPVARPAKAAEQPYTGLAGGDLEGDSKAKPKKIHKSPPHAIPRSAKGTVKDNKDSNNPNNLSHLTNDSSKARSKELEDSIKAGSPPPPGDGSPSAKEIARKMYEAMFKKGKVTNSSSIGTWTAAINKQIVGLANSRQITIFQAALVVNDLIEYHIEYIDDKYQPKIYAATKLGADGLARIEAAKERRESNDLSPGSSNNKSPKLTKEFLGGNKIVIHIKHPDYKAQD